MAKPEPSMDEWLKEAKQDPKAAQCGMFLTHNGVVRITPKAQVREGVEGLGDVAQVDFSYDAEGLEQAVKEALTWPGVYYVRVWLNEGVLNVGDSLMYVLIGADIRPNCIDALQKLPGVGRKTANLILGDIFGKPAIVSEHTGTAGLITEGVDGFVYEDDDPEKLAERLAWAIEHPEKLAAMRPACRELYESYYSKQAFSDSLQQAVKELAGE